MGIRVRMDEELSIKRIDKFLNGEETGARSFELVEALALAKVALKERRDRKLEDRKSDPTLEELAETLLAEASTDYEGGVRGQRLRSAANVIRTLADTIRFRTSPTS